MVYIDGILVFRKGEFELDNRGLIGLFGFRLVATSNAVIEYTDDSIKFLKNRNVIEDSDWTRVKQAMLLNESVRNKKR